MSTRLETGACFCGAVVAEMHGDPFWICYDHDDDCRRAIGSPLTIWVGYRPSEFRVVRGVLRSFSKSPFEKEASTIKELKDPRMANDIEVSSGFPVTMVNFTTTQLLARGLVSA
jgi:hypothetical protein